MPVFRSVRCGVLLFSVLIGTCQGSSASDALLKFERMSGAPDAFDPQSAAVRRGMRRDAMRLIAPVIVRAPLAGYSGAMLIEFQAAPVFNVGDGMRLEILLAGVGGDEVLYSRYFDPGRNAADRDWVRIEVPAMLPPQPKWLVLRLTGGPQGNLEADWLAISSMRLTRRVP
jgi:hypothetical protein